jgi:hypothetical protein
MMRGVDLVIPEKVQSFDLRNVWSELLLRISVKDSN